jgi:riboflavin kinase
VHSSIYVSTDISQLGIPTANIPVDNTPWIADAASGVYFGWVGVCLPAAHPDSPAGKEAWRQFPMVMSIGYNPFYRNTLRSAEVHVLHSFAADFYGAAVALCILGFVRPEYDYVSVEALVRDINIDIEVARRSLDRPAWSAARGDPYLRGEPAPEA